jgi:isocitrate lyase
VTEDETLDWKCTHAYTQSLTASKLYELVRNLREQGRCTTTFGCLDNAQLTQMCRFAETIYVSGWQASSHHSVSLTQEKKEIFHACLNLFF